MYSIRLLISSSQLYTKVTSGVTSSTDATTPVSSQRGNKSVGNDNILSFDILNSGSSVCDCIFIFLVSDLLLTFLTCDFFSTDRKSCSEIVAAVSPTFLTFSRCFLIFFGGFTTHMTTDHNNVKKPLKNITTATRSWLLWGRSIIKKNSDGWDQWLLRRLTCTQSERTFNHDVQKHISIWISVHFVLYRQQASADLGQERYLDLP